MIWLLTLLLAMSDPSAYKAAKMRWGAIGTVGQARCVAVIPGCPFSADNWTKQVGYISPACVNEFTVVGKGFNTWDAAFADADAHPAKINGPYAGMLTVTIGASDDVGVVSVQLFIDGTAYPIRNIMPPMPKATVSWMVDTAQLANDFHVVCYQGTNMAGLLSKSDNGELFQVNQATGMNGQTVGPGKEFLAFTAVTFAKP